MSRGNSKKKKLERTDFCKVSRGHSNSAAVNYKAYCLLMYTLGTRSVSSREQQVQQYLIVILWYPATNQDFQW